MKIVIPKKIKKVNNYNNNCYHYDLVKEYPNHVLYRCRETGGLESFCKNDFIKREVLESEEK